MPLPYDLTLIAGPTAAGKSALALAYAVRHNGAIINADASQIYNALPILTAQPTEVDRVRVPHDLYGVLAPDQTCSVGRWVDLAVAAVGAARSAGHHPVVVGGTGLYLNALVRGLSAMPAIDPVVRDRARALQQKMGNPAFHAELARIDPAMAARLRATDTQRLIRAYEVMIATRTSLAVWQDAPRMPPLGGQTIYKVLIAPPRDALRARARARLDHMIVDGVLDEITAFLARIDQGTMPADAPVTKALGFAPLADVARGTLPLSGGLEAAFLQTAHYIKRQQTWFRHQMVFDQTIIDPNITEITLGTIK